MYRKAVSWPHSNHDPGCILIVEDRQNRASLLLLCRGQPWIGDDHVTEYTLSAGGVVFIREFDC